MRSLRLAQPLRAGPRQSWRGYDHDRALSCQYLELATLGCACLVDVAGEDKLGAGGRQLLQHAAAAGEWALARAPRRVGELVVQADDAKRTGRRVPSRSAARSTSSVRRPPDWWRHGRTELTPTTCRPPPECIGSVVSHSRSNSCQGRVNLAGGSSGMS